ncbi:unnamed protein product [Rotaria socialis]
MFCFPGHPSNAMFISEIPVRCMSPIDNDETVIKWISNLNSRTTARDVIRLIQPTCDPTNYLLYIYTDRKKQILNESACIYKVVEKINREKCSRRLLFEIRLKKIQKKHVRFADEIILQNIVQRQCLSNETIHNNIIEIISKPNEKLKENFHNKFKSSSRPKRSSLSIINENISRSSSESGISSQSSTDDLIVQRKIIFETLV